MLHLPTLALEALRFEFAFRARSHVKRISSRGLRLKLAGGDPDACGILVRSRRDSLMLIYL